MTSRRLPREAVAAAGLIALDALTRIVTGGPYPGATFLLLVACGVSLLPLLPNELSSTSLRLAVLPALALGSYALLMTTVSVVGIGLTETSIRLAVLALVVVLAAVAPRVSRQEVPGSARREALAIAALAGVFCVSLAAGWSVVEPFPPPGSDWGYYLLQADEIEAQGSLAPEDPYGIGETRALGTYPGVGAVYGSLRSLDGVSSETLSRGLAVAVALTPLSVYAAVGALWGIGAGLLAAGAYAVAPIHLEPLYWHGLATTSGLLFLPLVVVALGLMYRGRRDRRVVGLLGFSLASLAVMHSVSAVVVGVLLALVLVADATGGMIRRAGAGAWWRDGMVKPVLAGIGMGCVVGVGVIVHVRQQAVELGSPVSYRFYDPDWLDRTTLEYYFSWPFLALVGVSLVLLIRNRTVRRDRALAAVAALVLSAVVVSQLWRVHVAFEYRRVVYYVAPALVILIGVGISRMRPRWFWLAGYAVAIAYIGHTSIGLRLPAHLLEGGEARSQTVDALRKLGASLDETEPDSRSLVVADGCLGVRAPYLVRSTTMIAFEEWQVGFENLVREASVARAVLGGGAEGRRLADELGVRYVVVDPRCSPNVEADVGGTAVFRGDELLIVELAGAA